VPRETRVIRSRLTLAAAIGVAALLLLVGRALSALLVDRAWYTAMGAPELWREMVLATVTLKGAAWLAGSAFAFANLWAVRRTIRSIAVPTRVADLEFIEEVPSRRLLLITLAAAAAVGVVLTVPLDDWTLLSAAWRGEPFAEYEGYFQRDLGFYVYWLPFEGALYTWALVAIVVVTMLVTLLYTLTRSLRFEGRQLVARVHVRRHLTALGALVLLLLSWSYRLDAYELLLWGSGFDGLFTAVDHRYTARIDLTLAVATFAAALIVLRTGWIGQVRAAFITVTLVLVASLALRQAGPEVVRNGALLGTADDARARDYEATRALFTRRAYGVDAITFRDPVIAPDTGTSDTGTATPADGLGRTALWNAAALARLGGAGDATFSPVAPPVWQRGRSGPEAIVVTRTTAVDPVWDVRIVPGTAVGERGGPIISRHAALRGLALPEPLVAPGLEGYRLVDAERPLGGDRGTADSAQPLAPFTDRRIPAARLTNPGVRLAHAWATRDVSLLRDADPQEAAVVMHRDVRSRVARLVPQLAQGGAVTPIMHGNTLLWAIDVYSASEHYPLSIRFALAGEARSYFRHAATVLVDARTGAVRIVRTAQPDPIARTAFSLIPSLVVTPEELPATLREQLPIATDGALAELRAFTRVGSRRTGSTPHFVPDSLPGVEPFPVALADDGAIAWSVPVVDDADHVVGIFESRGGLQRGSTWHAMPEPFPVWSALAGRLGAALDSVTTAAAGMTDGPLVTGTTSVQAIGGRPWLLRPTYTADVDGLHLVALAIATDSSARAAGSLEALTGERPAGDPALPLPVDRTDSWRTMEARRLYDGLRDAMRRGEWLRFGATLDTLGRVLDRTP
jgi:hypothetical protein